MEYIIESGCLSKDTNILMADGSTRKICDVRIGDLLQSTNGMTSVNNIWLGQEEKMLALKTCNKTLTLTEEHPVLLNDGTWVRADNIKEGNIVQTKDGNEEVISITILKDPSEVYNFDIEDEDVAFFAEGIAVGDMRRENMIR